MTFDVFWLASFTLAGLAVASLRLRKAWISVIRLLFMRHAIAGPSAAGMLLSSLQG